MMFGLTSLAEAMPKLVTDGGAATAIGVWVLMAIVASAGALFIYNQILSVKLKQKQIDSPAVIQQQINPQPLIVAMEKEFVHRRDYDRDWGAFREEHTKANQVVKDRIETVAKYSDDRLHAFTKHLAKIEESSFQRGERLCALEADSKTHTRQLASIEESIGNLREDLGFQRGRNERS